MVGVSGVRQRSSVKSVGDRSDVETRDVRTRTRPRTRLTELVNFMHVRDECPKSCHFRISSHSLNLARNSSNAVTYFLYWWHPCCGMDQYMDVDLKYILGPYVIWPCARLPFPSIRLGNDTTVNLRQCAVK